MNRCLKIYLLAVKRKRNTKKGFTKRRIKNKFIRRPLLASTATKPAPVRD